MLRQFAMSSVASLFLVACAAQSDDFERHNAQTGKSDPSATGTTPAADTTQPGVCQVGLKHLEFGGDDAVADRIDGALGADRRRVKPYSALRTEFTRVLGTIPSALTASAAAYGTDVARWYGEPTAGAVSLYTTYSVAFTGCYDTMTDSKYATAPTDATATTECAAMQRKAWQRTATPDETRACSDLAVTGLASESVPRRRWAHACASVITSAGFTSY